MATLPTPEENARKVLQIFKYFQTRPGGALGGNSIYTTAANWDCFHDGDLRDGLKYGQDNDWFEDGPNGGILLTESGYAEI